MEEFILVYGSKTGFYLQALDEQVKKTISIYWYNYMKSLPTEDDLSMYIGLDN